jgi:hypothetical protein
MWPLSKQLREEEKKGVTLLTMAFHWTDRAWIQACRILPAATSLYDSVSRIEHQSPDQNERQNQNPKDCSTSIKTKPQTPDGHYSCKNALRSSYYIVSKLIAAMSLAHTCVGHEQFTTKAIIIYHGKQHCSKWQESLAAISKGNQHIAL